MKEKNNNPEYIGQKYGRLTVVGFRWVEIGDVHAWHWDCTCDCGGKVIGARPRSVRNGTTRSCGCLKKEQDPKNLADARRSHGKTNTRLYGTWSKMKHRCNNQNDAAYKNYGGRGITVCKDWEESFEVFYDWAMKNGYNDTLTIERIDVEKGYCPENCCWITKEEQAKNKRNIRYVAVRGEKMPMKTACDLLGLPYKTIHLRVTRYGMSFEQAIEKPI